MDEQEFKEFFRELEEQGWEPQICDKAIPFFDNPVKCGSPDGIGDLDYDTMMVPSSWTYLNRIFCTVAKGDSMIDANIEEGDRLIVEETNAYNDGDILLVSIDEEYTLKSFFRDSDGTPWLVPQNPAYKAFPLQENQNVKVHGVVRRIQKTSPRVSFLACQKYINKAKAKQKGIKEFSPQQVAQTIREVAPMIKVARHWYAVFKVLMDAGILGLWDYDGFCVMVKEELPDNKHLPTRLELQRMACGSFAKSVVLWTENDAPVKGKRFDTYKNIALKTEKILEK